MLLVQVVVAESHRARSTPSCSHHVVLFVVSRQLDRRAEHCPAVLLLAFVRVGVSVRYFHVVVPVAGLAECLRTVQTSVVFFSRVRERVK